jgi:hypothetical protein
MPTLLELVVQLDEALGAAPSPAGSAAAALRQLTDALASAPTAREEFCDASFEVMPTLVAASALSPECDAAARGAIAAAAEVGAARDVLTLLAAALSEAADGDHEDRHRPPPAHGPRAVGFQLFLLRQAAAALARVQRGWVAFLAEFLDLQRRWATAALVRFPAAPAGDGGASLGDALDALRDGWALAAETAAARAAAAEDKAHADTLLCRAALRLSAVTLQHAGALRVAERALARALAEAGGRGALGQRLRLADAPLRELAAPAARVSAQVASLGLRSPAAARDAAGSGEGQGEVEVGLAMALWASLADEACALEPPAEPAELLRAAGAAAAALTDLAATHESAALAALPLALAAKVAERLERAGRLLGEDKTGAADALVDATVAAMSFSPLEAVRAAAHEALQRALDAHAPAARLARLRALVRSDSASAVAVALQRLRAEVAAGAATPADALDAAAPWLRRGAWLAEGGLVRGADAAAAALALARFVLLRAPGGETPDLLRHARLREWVAEDLAALEAATGASLQAQHAALQAQRAAGAEDPAALEAFLALARLEEAAGAAREAARRRLKDAAAAE